MRYRSLGHSRALVVLDAGFASADQSWVGVARLITSFARVLIIDRSDYRCWPNGDHSLAKLAESTAELIDTSDIGAPTIVVGLGTGSLIARRLLDVTPSLIDGCLLIDPVPEPLPDVPASTGALDPNRATGYLGRLLSDILAVRSVIGENSLDAETPPALPDVPLTVITRGALPAPDDDVAQQWMSSQLNQLPRTPRTRHIIAGRGDQSIPNERPDVVVGAIRELVSRQWPRT
jgi:pimeloyl-ACP methyl ester carboxylesterase